MSQNQTPNAAPQFHQRQKRTGRHRSPGDRALWQLGVLAAPPAAVFGLALAVMGYVAPALAVIPILRSTEFFLIAACGISLVVILYDVRPGSTRLRRGKVWLAIALALLTIPSLLYVDRRARRIAGEYVPQAAGTGGMDAPPSDR